MNTSNTFTKAFQPQPARMTSVSQIQNQSIKSISHSLYTQTLFIKRFSNRFMDCTFLLLRPSKHSHILNSTQPPPPQSFSFTHPTTTTTTSLKQSCDAMLCYVSNIRKVCDGKYVMFRIFETYAMLYYASNIRKIAAIPCCVSNIRNNIASHHNTMHRSERISLLHSLVKRFFPFQNSHVTDSQQTQHLLCPSKITPLENSNVCFLSAFSVSPPSTLTLSIPLILMLIIP
jgi:hypothetical protein